MRRSSCSNPEPLACSSMPYGSAAWEPVNGRQRRANPFIPVQLQRSARMPPPMRNTGLDCQRGLFRAPPAFDAGIDRQLCKPGEDVAIAPSGPLVAEFELLPQARRGTWPGLTGRWPPMPRPGDRLVRHRFRRGQGRGRPPRSSGGSAYCHPTAGRLSVPCTSRSTDSRRSSLATGA